MRLKVVSGKWTVTAMRPENHLAVVGHEGRATGTVRRVARADVEHHYTRSVVVRSIRGAGVAPRASGLPPEGVANMLILDDREDPTQRGALGRALGLQLKSPPTAVAVLDDP